MQKKLKICHIITRMIIGGAQENTLLSAIGHIENGHESVLITGPTTGPEGKLLEKYDNLKKLEIIELPNLKRNISPLNDILSYFELRKILKKYKFDVVHTHSSKAGIIGRIAATHEKVPCVVHTVHGQAFHKYEKPWKNFIYKTGERLAAKYCHKIFAVAQAMIDQCVEAKIAPISKYKVVYSGMDINLFLNSKENCELRKNLEILPNTPVVGVIARLFPLKGYEDLIPVAAKVAKKIPSVKFLIIGNGILKNKLLLQIKDLGISNNFIFIGLIAPEEIHKYTPLMNILLHLSLREGLPRTVVQALASSKPAIAYNLDGTPEVIINGETGFIISPRDIDETAEKTIELLNDEKKAKEMGLNGKKLVAKKFDWRRMVKILEEEYKSLIFDVAKREMGGGRK